MFLWRYVNGKWEEFDKCYCILGVENLEQIAVFWLLKCMYNKIMFLVSILKF